MCTVVSSCGYHIYSDSASSTNCCSKNVYKIAVGALILPSLTDVLFCSRVNNVGQVLSAVVNSIFRRSKSIVHKSSNDPRDSELLVPSDIDSSLEQVCPLFLADCWTYFCIRNVQNSREDFRSLSVVYFIIFASNRLVQYFSSWLESWINMCRIGIPIYRPILRLSMKFVFSSRI